MDFTSIFGETFVVWVLIPLFILIARIIDVSISTIRIIFLGKGFRKMAAILGFIEAVVWITAISQIMQNLNNAIYYLFWGIGFAAGTYIGMLIESKLAMGQVVVRIITRYDATALNEYLFSRNFSVTSTDARGTLADSVKIMFLIIQRNQLPEVIDIIKEYNPNAVYTVEDVRMVSDQLSKTGAPNFQTFLKSFRRTNRTTK